MNKLRILTIMICSMVLIELSTSMVLNKSFAEEGKNGQINIKEGSYYTITQRSKELSEEIDKIFSPYPKEIGTGVICSTGYNNQRKEFVVHKHGSGTRMYKDSSGRFELKIPDKYNTYKTYKCEDIFVLNAEPFYFATTNDNKLIFRHPSVDIYYTWSLGSEVQEQFWYNLNTDFYNESDNKQHKEQLKQLAKMQWEYISSIAANLYHPDDKKLANFIKVYKKYNQDSKRLDLPKIDKFPKQSMVSFNDIKSNPNKLTNKTFKLAVTYLDYIGKGFGGYRDWPDLYQFLASHKLKELDHVNSDRDSATKFYDFNNDNFVDIDEFISMQVPYLKNRIYYGGTNIPIHVKEPQWDYGGKNKIDLLITARNCKQKYKYDKRLSEFKIKTASNDSYHSCLRTLNEVTKDVERCVANSGCRGEPMFKLAERQEYVVKGCKPIIDLVNKEFDDLVGVCSDYLSKR